MRGLVAYLLKHGQLTALLGATILHVVVFGIVLSSPRSGPTHEPSTPILITLYEAPEPDLAPEPEPEQEPEQEPAPVPTSIETQQPETSAPAPEAHPAQSPQTVTSFTEAPDQTETIVQPPITSDQGPPVQDASTQPTALEQAASILQRAECNRLGRDERPDCPPSDPFAAAEALQDLQTPKGPISIPDLQAFGPQGMAESYMSARGWKPSMPGPGSAEGLGAISMINLGSIDNSIFIDPMAEGVYNAQRIRNGQSPIWDKEIEDALKDARDQR